MATILLASAGAALGGSLGGTLGGLSTVAVGRAVGATLGRVIDGRLLGSGSDPVETGRVDRFRLSDAGEGAPVASVYGRMRVGGQIIWASDFQELATVTGGGGGKGRPSQPQTTRYSYSVSLAVAICEGEILSVGRVWADGEDVSPRDLNMTVYRGTPDQLPDPVIEAIEGAGTVPAYRGTAYVVFEDLALEPFGNRVPQFSFEVVRASQPGAPDHESDPVHRLRGVALVPGTGEYALATTQVNYSSGPGSYWSANSHTPSGRTDFLTSTDALTDELPGCGSVALVVSWFGNDLRCGQCSLRPKVERQDIDGINMPWTVSGLNRQTAQEIARQDGRPIYGGTPADAAVAEAIAHLRQTGKRVMFYPFVLMDQLDGNGLADPWTGEPDQPQLPWRGRITLDIAPGRTGSADGTVAADAQVQAFFGSASASDFTVGDGVVAYSGPPEWGLRRFILHYAALCAAAGGVDVFCIGSELRGLTQIRGAAGFPAVDALRALAGEVRALLGPETSLGYAADWSEYFGYQPVHEPGDRYFHLDPLWGDDNIDFVGIDNYMPLSDWREGEAHRDRTDGWQSIHDPDYLQDNIEGGEGYDWYYASPQARDAQIRTPITDDDHDEPWIWRYKDLRNWWSRPHHERVGGVRLPDPTAWIPGSKPIYFTEFGCAAIDKGTNQPNRFLDPKSSESGLPVYSTGARDDLIQRQYLRAVLEYWQRDDNNPVSDLYGGPMIDLDNAYAWAWDTRPFPAFPNNRDQWSDGANFSRGHWLNGRAGSRTLASVVAEICRGSGFSNVDVSRLHGMVSGYAVDQVGEARSALQPLMLRYGFDAVERDGALQFRMRSGQDAVIVAPQELAVAEDFDGLAELTRDAEAELSGRVRLRFVQAGAGFDVVSEETVLPDDRTHGVSENQMQLAMTRAEGRQTVERWLAEARLARDSVRFALPPSKLAIGAGDTVRLPSAGGDGLFRVDRVDQGRAQMLEAVRIEPSVYDPPAFAEDEPAIADFTPPLPVLPYFLDLPLLSGDEVAHAPHLAVTAAPWPGTVAIYSSASDEDYRLNRVIAERSVIGFTETEMAQASAGIWDNGPALQIRLTGGALQSRTDDAVLGGANLAAIGDGTTGNWELFQFGDADLIAPDTYLVTRRLRGQLGSDGLMPPQWPVGSVFVLLNGAPMQIDLAAAERRLARHFRIGPARRGYDDPSYVYRLEAFDGNGLRPYAPAHLSARRLIGDDLRLSWIRRTRIDGDDWTNAEVPLGEESESYLVRVLKAGALRREMTLSQPVWTYSAAMQAADGVASPFDVEVAQISARYGPGPATRLQGLT